MVSSGPVFMNVGTVAAIKGAVSTEDLETDKDTGRVVKYLSSACASGNPADQRNERTAQIYGMGQANFNGFRRISGVFFKLTKDQRRRRLFPFPCGRQKNFYGTGGEYADPVNLASTIAMAFDECPSSVAERSYVENSVARTTRWLERCKKEMARLNSLEDTINKNQMLFGINQGAIFEDIRIDHAKRIAEMDLDGYAIGGLAVGESHEEMYHIIEAVVPHLPVEKPTYLMGVGTPANILEGVERGVDFFDCVYPTRNGRHGHLYTNQGKINLFNKKYEKDMRPIEEGCQCPACRRYSRAYIRHLLKAKEMLGMRLCVLHNLYFYNTMMEEIRDAIEKGAYQSYKEEKLYGMGQLTSGISKGDL